MPAAVVPRPLSPVQGAKTNRFVAVIRDPVDGDVVCFCLLLGELGSGLIGWSRTITGAGDTDRRPESDLQPLAISLIQAKIIPL